MWGEEFRTGGLIVNASRSAHSSQRPPCLRLGERLVKDFLWEEFVRPVCEVHGHWAGSFHPMEKE